MIGLKDIAPSTESVEIRGKRVHVPGVSGHGIAYLISRFPEIRDMFQQKKLDLSPEKLLQLVPEAVAAVIACGTGAVADEEAEKVAAGLSAAEQLAFIDAIIRATMPGGVRPFVETLNGLVAGFRGLSEDSGTAPDTN